MSKILITGATGLIGGEISKLLQRLNTPHRVLVRNSSGYKSVDSELVEVIEGRFEDPQSLQKALAGISHSFLASFDRPDAIDLQRNFIDAARDCGVKHIVRMSTIGIEVSQQLPIFAWHGKCEAQLEASGMSYTHLQPAWVMQNFLGLVQEGVIRLPAGDGQSGFVDARDIAAVAVEALTKPGHADKSYQMSSEVLSHYDIARIISEACGQPIAYEDVSLEEYQREITRSGWPESDIVTMVGLYSNIRKGAGFDAIVTSTIEEVLGRPGLTFSEFANDYASCFKI